MNPIRLKALRKIHGMRQQDLAEKINISQQSISRYENGQHYPDIPALIEMADFFDVPLDYLVGRKWPKGSVSELYVNAAAEYAAGENEEELTDGAAGARAVMDAEIMHIISASKASEALSQDSLDLSALSPKRARQMRELYKTMLAAEKNESK